MQSQGRRCAGPLSRREFLRVGGLALGGLGLADIAAARASAPLSQDTSVIMVYCSGGASQLETYDLKPSGPSNMRSVFAPIATCVPGMSICELLPLHAKVADRFSIIRSMSHRINIHNDGSILVLTGKEPSVPDPTSTAKSEHPEFGMIASRVRGPHPDAVPQYVNTPYAFHMTRPTYLGAGYQPFTTGDPSQRGYAPQQLSLRGMNVAGLDNRRRLLGELDLVRSEMDRTAASEGIDQFRQ